MGSTMYMTGEQIEVLRKQIAAFATLSEMLVDMHSRIIAQQESIPAQVMRYGGVYSDQYAPSYHKIATRQRWTPTPMQLQILEKYFCEGIGTPSKQKIQEIASELAHHGQITEMNIYNWFQNRRARSKRKRQSSVQPDKMGYKALTEAGDRKTKKAKSTVPQLCSNIATGFEGVSSETPEIGSNMHHVYFTESTPSMTLPNDGLGAMAQSSYLSNMVTTQDIPDSFNFADVKCYYDFAED